MRTDYHERKERRIERAREKAEKSRKEGDARLKNARKILSYIPMGQPIMVGHHSEKRHRSDLKKI